MARKVFIKSAAIVVIFSLLFNMMGIHAYSAKKGFYDGTWTIESSLWSSFDIYIKGDKFEAFSLDYAGGTYNFPSVSIDMEENYFVTSDGRSRLEVIFDPSDNTTASGSLMLWPNGNQNAVFGYSVITAHRLGSHPSTTPKPSNVTTLNKTSWENILPDKDAKLAGSLACLNDAAWNGKNYVIAGRGKILSSTDGASWKTAYLMTEDKALYGVVWNGKEYVAIGTDEADNSVIVLKSTDAKTWEVINPELNGYMLDIAWNNKLYVAVGMGGVLITSADGTEWTKSDINIDSDFHNVIWAGSRFVAVGNDVIATSVDAYDWKVITDKSGNFNGAVYYKGQYCIFSMYGGVLLTKDFKNWDSRQIEFPSGSGYIINVACSDDEIMAAMSNENGEGVLSTTDLSKWTLDLLQQKDYVLLNNVVYVNGRFYAVGPQYISLYKPESARQIKVIINGSTKKLTQEPYMSGKVPMLPVKSVLEAAGLKVTVSGSKVTVSKGTKKAALTVNSSKAVLNKKSVTLEAKVASKNGTVYAPLEKVVEALGGTYTWDENKKTVTIKFKK